MCIATNDQPYAVPLKLRYAKNGTLILTYSLLLGKVTEKVRGRHISSMGITYPVGGSVYDQQAIVGDHDSGLHFAATPLDTETLVGFGSHRLAVLPAPKVWDPVKHTDLTDRCWHSTGCTIAACLDCEGILPSVLTNPLFWQDLRKRYGSSPDDIIYRTPLYKIWHRSRALASE
jgi:hypothetical protein